jgi:hypothetical protein
MVSGEAGGSNGTQHNDGPMSRPSIAEQKYVLHTSAGWKGMEALTAYAAFDR